MQLSIHNLKQPQIGGLIRELRKEMGLTQEQFAASIGVVYPSVNRWENGHACPSPMALKLIEVKLQKIEKGEKLLKKYGAK